MRGEGAHGSVPGGDEVLRSLKESKSPSCFAHHNVHQLLFAQTISCTHNQNKESGVWNQAFRFKFKVGIVFSDPIHKIEVSVAYALGGVPCDSTLHA